MKGEGLKDELNSSQISSRVEKDFKAIVETVQNRKDNFLKYCQNVKNEKIVKKDYAQRLTMRVDKIQLVNKESKIHSPGLEEISCRTFLEENGRRSAEKNTEIKEEFINELEKINQVKEREYRKLEIDEIKQEFNKLQNSQTCFNLEPQISPLLKVFFKRE